MNESGEGESEHFLSSLKCNQNSNKKKDDVADVTINMNEDNERSESESEEGGEVKTNQEPAQRLDKAEEQCLMSKNIIDNEPEQTTIAQSANNGTRLPVDIYCSTTSLNVKNAKICRICHSNEPNKELIAPCNCAGTLKYVHQNCLQHWLRVNGNKSCEICKRDFITRTKINSLQKWKKLKLTSKQKKRLFLMNFLYFAAIICNLWSIHSFSSVLYTQFKMGVYDWKFYTILGFSISTLFCIIWFVISLFQLWFEIFIKFIRFNQSIQIRSK